MPLPPRMETMNGELMSTARTRPAWPGVITAAAIAVALSAPVIYGQAHQGPRQAATRPASAAIICPPPSGDGAVVAMSKTGDPGCAVHSGRINSCPDPDCVRGVPPATASAMECTDPRCVSGTQPAAAPRPGSRVTGRTGHGGPPAAAWPQAAARTSTVSADQINCPPPNPKVTSDISDF